MSNGEYRKMEKELREWIGGAQIVPDGEEDKFRFKRRIKVLKVKEKEKPGTEKTMGRISRIRRIIRAIFAEEKKQDN